MKRIIICSDGTWNKPNTSDNGKKVRTNVQKFFDLIAKSDSAGTSQMRFYDEGVGAQGNLLTRCLNGATGRGIDDNIKDGYKFIIWNYEPGDEIYLFGFSRGAYTARSLAGLIRNCGIIKTNNLELIDEAYTIYRNRKNTHGPDSKIAEDFKTKNCYPDDFRIKLVGVWDTVGSLGMPLGWFQWYNKMKYQFYDTTLSSLIENAYHALALDEKRKNFVPSIWTPSEKVRNKEIRQVVEQRWFAGVHSDVGGGYVNEGLQDISLLWMIEKAGAAGLAFDNAGVLSRVKPDLACSISNSRTGIYKFLPSSLRKAHPQDLHDTVHAKMKLKPPPYSPTNIHDSHGRINFPL
jgi:uncharacterized protein (DUF2235 family)